jgi:hypothetical protein
VLIPVAFPGGFEAVVQDFAPSVDSVSVLVSYMLHTLSKGKHITKILPQSTIFRSFQTINKILMKLPFGKENKKRPVELSNGAGKSC